MTNEKFPLMFLIFGMLTLIIVILAIGWFVWKANQRNKNPLTWGLLAAAAYLIPANLTEALVKNLQEGTEQTADNILALVMWYHGLSFLAGLLGCYLLKKILVDRAILETNPDTGSEAGPERD